MSVDADSLFKIESKWTNSPLYSFHNDSRSAGEINLSATCSVKAVTSSSLNISPLSVPNETETLPCNVPPLCSSSKSKTGGIKARRKTARKPVKGGRISDAMSCDQASPIVKLPKLHGIIEINFK